MKPIFVIGRIRNVAWVITMCLVFVFPAWATAPRFAPEWFQKDVESLPVVVAHEYPPYRSVSIDGKGHHARIVSAVFAVAGEDVELVVQPARSLMIYALSQEETAAVVGEEADFEGISRERLVFVPFHIKEARYFYYRPNHDGGSNWDGKLENMRGTVLGLEGPTDVQVWEKAGISVALGALPALLERLVAGEIDILGADAERTEWLIRKRMPGKEKQFVAMEIPAWDSFSYVVFNKNLGIGESSSARFVDALKRLLRDGGYDLILQNAGSRQALSNMQRKKLIQRLDSLKILDD